MENLNQFFVTFPEDPNMKYGYVTMYAINHKIATDNIRSIYCGRIWHIHKTIDKTRFPHGNIHTITIEENNFSELFCDIEAVFKKHGYSDHSIVVCFGDKKNAAISHHVENVCSDHALDLINNTIIAIKHES